jgi:peroxiredoxin Q/BCP
MADHDVGDPAPEFALLNHTGETVRLGDRLGQPLVLYFYPGDFTPVCTREACQFQDELPAFDRLDAHVIGISSDPPHKHAEFRDEHDLEFELLSDEDGKVTEAYGVDGLLGTQRVTFVVDPEGVIVERVRWPLPGRHVSSALDAIEEMNVA